MTLPQHARGALLVLLAVLPGCNCGDDLPGTDAGTSDASVQPVDAGLAIIDAGGTVVDAGGAIDAGGQVDAGSVVDSGVIDAGEVDAGSEVVDAGPADAGPADAGPLNVLYAHIDSTLVSVDLATGAITPIGPTNQEWITLAWDDSSKLARAITGGYSPVGTGALTPMLGTVDLCTGAIDAGVKITVDGGQVRRAEGLARNPDGGTFFIAIGRTGTGSSTQYLTESNGTIDVETGAVTILGNHQTLQDDGDCMTFVGDTLYLMDVATANNSGQMYQIDQNTGAAMAAVNSGPKVLRIAYDSTRNMVFATYGETNGTTRGVGTLDLTTGTLTKLGSDIANSLYPGAHFTGLMSTPPHVCP